MADTSIQHEHLLERCYVAAMIFDALREHPYGLKTSELIYHVYKGQEPKDPERCICLAIMRFNRRAERIGSAIRIRNRQHAGRVYRIHIVKPT